MQQLNIDLTDHLYKNIMELDSMALGRCNYKGIVMGAINSIKRGSQAGWIPVNEKLPEDGTWALFTNGRQISVERYKMDAIDHFFPSGRWFELEEAIAWMPLPDPYQEKKEAADETQ